VLPPLLPLLPLLPDDEAVVASGVMPPPLQPASAATTDKATTSGSASRECFDTMEVVIACS
jgi:hypothetical protein